MKIVRNDNYLKFGFTVIENKPQCVICFETLSTESMKPSKLVLHLNTKLPNEKNERVELFNEWISIWHKKANIEKAMTGAKSGFIAILKEQMPNAC